MISRKMQVLRTALTLAAMSALLLFAAVRPANAQVETVLYNFCSVQPNCADGYTPYAGVLYRGAYYGTTPSGGANASGIVFKVSLTGKQSVLHSFPSQAFDGIYPYGGLIADTSGNLYGTTAGGGANGYGTVFKLSPTGVETILYNFCSLASCADGAGPLYEVLTRDTAGNLYGTTASGGANNWGTVFMLTPAGKETVLYSFCAQMNCPDGASPNAGVIRDAKGNLYGTTYQGGASNFGTVFKVSSAGAETVLHSFAGSPTDGYYPTAGLIKDAKGNFYGTTTHGGVGFSGGTVFKVTPTAKETVLYTFCSLPSCVDGSSPFGGLIMDKLGNLYSTTRGGGANNGAGTIFELSVSGTESVLYNFCSKASCTDGAGPFAGVVMDAKGNLYGTTQGGGSKANGVVFKFTP